MAAEQESSWMQGQDGWESREYQLPDGTPVKESRRRGDDGVVLYRDMLTPTTIDRWNSFGEHEHVDLTQAPLVKVITDRRGRVREEPVFHK